MVSYLASHFCTPFAKYAATFFRQLASPLLALHSQARSLLISTDSLRKPSSPLDGGMIPAVPAHPAHHSSGPADHKKQPPTRSSGPFTRDLTHNPEPIRAPRSRHSPILSRHQNTGSPLSEKNHSLHPAHNTPRVSTSGWRTPSRCSTARGRPADGAWTAGRVSDCG